MGALDHWKAQQPAPRPRWRRAWSAAVPWLVLLGGLLVALGLVYLALEALR